MKKNFILVFVLLFVTNASFANYQSSKNYKLIERNSRGQKVSYTKIYYKGDKSNVTKINVYSTNGKRIKQYRK